MLHGTTDNDQNPGKKKSSSVPKSGMIYVFQILKIYVTLL